MTTLKRLQLIITTALLLVSASYAQPGGGQFVNKDRSRLNPDRMIRSLDLNRDQKISQEEAMRAESSRLVSQFEELDLNGDGFLDRNELVQRDKEPVPETVMLNAKQLLAEVDIDQNGYIDEFEVAVKENEILKKHFAAIDKNLDGKLDEAELSSFGIENEKN